MNLSDGGKLNVLITGASGGLGTYITNEFIRRRTNLALVAFPGNPLDDMAKSAREAGCKAIAMAADLRERDKCRYVVERTTAEFGDIDLLINNAGIEFTSYFHELPEDAFIDVLRLNLEAPMILTRLVLPPMLSRKRGHIVNISSLAGKAGPAYQEPYAASKAGLVAFTVSLRATYHGSGVSASVICPGFVEAGIYARLKQTTGCNAPSCLGTSRPETVVRAIVRAIERDLPEVIVNPIPVRPLFALTALFPSVGELLVRKMGVHNFFRRVRDAETAMYAKPQATITSNGRAQGA